MGGTVSALASLLCFAGSGLVNPAALGADPRGQLAAMCGFKQSETGKICLASDNFRGFHVDIPEGKKGIDLLTGQRAAYYFLVKERCKLEEVLGLAGGLEMAQVALQDLGVCLSEKYMSGIRPDLCLHLRERYLVIQSPRTLQPRVVGLTPPGRSQQMLDSLDLRDVFCPKGACLCLRSKIPGVKIMKTPI